MPRNKRYVVRICTDNSEIIKGVKMNYIEPTFLTCLENAGLGKVHDTDRDGYTFDLFPPQDSPYGGKVWAEQNAARISSFGFNAVAAPRWED